MIGINRSFHNENDSMIVIQRLANGWMVTLPIVLPDGPDEFDKFNDVMMNVASNIQAVKEPILREAEQKEKPKEPNAPLIGYIPPKQNVFVFHEYDALLAFLKDNIW